MIHRHLFIYCVISIKSNTSLMFDCLISWDHHKFYTWQPLPIFKFEDLTLFHYSIPISENSSVNSINQDQLELAYYIPFENSSDEKSNQSQCYRFKRPLLSLGMIWTWWSVIGLLYYFISTKFENIPIIFKCTVNLWKANLHEFITHFLICLIYFTSILTILITLSHLSDMKTYWLSSKLKKSKFVVMYHKSFAKFVFDLNVILPRCSMLSCKLGCQISRFHVHFWLSHILVYLFYFCPSWDWKFVILLRYKLCNDNNW